jgi:hypothetical protein
MGGQETSTPKYLPVSRCQSKKNPDGLDWSREAMSQETGAAASHKDGKPTSGLPWIPRTRPSTSSKSPHRHHTNRPQAPNSEARFSTLLLCSSTRPLSRWPFDGGALRVRQRGGVFSVVGSRSRSVQGLSRDAGNGAFTHGHGNFQVSEDVLFDKIPF